MFGIDGIGSDDHAGDGSSICDETAGDDEEEILKGRSGHDWRKLIENSGKLRNHIHSGPPCSMYLDFNKIFIGKMARIFLFIKFLNPSRYSP